MKNPIRKVPEHVLAKNTAIWFCILSNSLNLFNLFKRMQHLLTDLSDNLYSLFLELDLPKLQLSMVDLSLDLL